MTRDEILTMPAGRELDALVAERVMGWRDCQPRRVLERDGDNQTGWGTAPNGDLKPIPPYSQEIAAAWAVVKRFVPYVKVDARGDGRGNWSCSVWTGGPEITGYGPTAPLAICRAALLAGVAEPAAAG